MQITEQMAAKLKKLPHSQQEQFKAANRRIGNAENELQAARDHMRELVHRLGLNK